MKKNILSVCIVLFFFGCTQAQSLDSAKTKEAATEESSSFSDSPKETARKKIEAFRQRVLDGESMAALAALYTDDPGSKKTGGAYYNVARGQFVPEFEAAAFNLEVGGISSVFETQYGFHFVQLIARRGDVIDVRHILVAVK